MRRQQLLPAARGLPIAVIGVGQGGTDNDHTKFLHGRFIHEWQYLGAGRADPTKHLFMRTF
jgi:hypothetical protein